MTTEEDIDDLFIEPVPRKATEKQRQAGLRNMAKANALRKAKKLEEQYQVELEGESGSDSESEYEEPKEKKKHQVRKYRKVMEENERLKIALNSITETTSTKKLKNMKKKKKPIKKTIIQLPVPTPAINSHNPRIDAQKEHIQRILNL